MSGLSIMIDVALKTTVVLGVALVATALLRKRSAAARHLVWTGAAAAVLALPFLSAWMPPLRVPASAFLGASTGVTFRTTASSLPATGGPEPVAHRSPASPAPLAPAGVNWSRLLMLLWGAGTAIVLAQMLMAQAVVRRIRRLARPFPDRGLCVALKSVLGIRHPVEVLETEAGRMPMACGLLRPAVLIPADMAYWSDERRRVVLMHELGHVYRGDVATHLLARAAFALSWWNPLAWTAWREFLKERERATDDVVLNAGARASDYAGHLLEVARSMQSARTYGWAGVTMARRSQLEGRLLAILDSGVNRRVPARLSALVAVCLAVCAVAPLAAVRAQAPEQEQAAGVPADVDTAIRSATVQRNHEILENAAKAAEQLGQYETAQKLLESALAIRGQVSGQESASYGLGLIKLGDLESKRRRIKEAEDFYTRAAQVMGDKPEAAPALMYMGTAAIIRKDFGAAIDHLQRAQRLDPTRAGMASMWMAVARQGEENVHEAESLYRTALSLQDPKSPEAVVIGRVYSQFLRAQGRQVEADELDARTRATQKANAPKKPTLSSGIHRVGAGVTPPQLLQKKEPEYSLEARAAKLAGSSVLYAEIGLDGLAHNVQVVERLGLGLDEKAVEAISQWRFKPGAKDGKPVTVAATIEVNFKLL